MTLEKLKLVTLGDLSREQVLEHQRAVLDLSTDDCVTYLEYAIDTFYKTLEEGENQPMVNLFFEAPEFKPCYDLILNKADEC